MELAEHANKVMTTLDEGIKELDDLDNFFQYLTQVGATHKNIPGFNPDYFWVSTIFNPFDTDNKVFKIKDYIRVCMCECGCV